MKCREPLADERSWERVQNDFPTCRELIVTRSVSEAGGLLSSLTLRVTMRTGIEKLFPTRSLRNNPCRECSN